VLQIGLVSRHAVQGYLLKVQLCQFWMLWHAGRAGFYGTKAASDSYLRLSRLCMSQVRFQGFCDFQFHLFGTITKSTVVSLCAKLTLLCFFPNLSLHNMAASTQGKVFLETGRFYTESPKVVAARIERAQRPEKEEKPPATVENLNSQIGRRKLPPDLKDSRHFVK
jgi:hypothetical protein